MKTLTATAQARDVLVASSIAGIGMLACLSGFSFAVVKTIQLIGLGREETS